MTPERYRKIGEPFHATLESEADERNAFLELECTLDAELRREVESLIRSHEEGVGVIDEPALSFAAGLLAEDTAEQFVEQTLARRYRVLSLLGAGGMGRVYLAEDAELSRRVALKLLPEHLTHDGEQVRRFRQEARAASALNHPNIITVYEINEAGGASVIASEYIEGETLRERLSGCVLYEMLSGGPPFRGETTTGDRLRVSVNLLRAGDGASLWAESFDVRFTDIFAIQDEVSKEVAARLRLKLSPAEQARLARHHTADPEAYSYYTKAMPWPCC